jgi:predicted helicase
VIIGNPPYNAWQENFNFRNPNRPYKEIDKRIKETYVESGDAQNQIALYDIYVRFFRWASDRLAENGILALVTNRSYLDSNTFDGFRKSLQANLPRVGLLILAGTFVKTRSCRVQNTMSSVFKQE